MSGASQCGFPDPDSFYKCVYRWLSIFVHILFVCMCVGKAIPCKSSKNAVENKIRITVCLKNEFVHKSVFVGQYLINVLLLFSAGAEHDSHRRSGLVE